MVQRSRRNRSKQQKRSRKQQQNRRSRHLNLLGGGDSVSLLYVNMNKDNNSEKYELILGADNFNDLVLQAGDVSENMQSSFKNEVNNHMYIQTHFLNRNMNTSKIIKLSSKAMMNAKGNRISSNDNSILYYTTDSLGLVTAIYENREELQSAFPEADIKSIKKNKLDWKHPLFA